MPLVPLVHAPSKVSTLVAATTRELQREHIVIFLLTLSLSNITYTHTYFLSLSLSPSYCDIYLRVYIPVTPARCRRRSTVSWSALLQYDARAPTPHAYIRTCDTTHTAPTVGHTRMHSQTQACDDSRHALATGTTRRRRRRSRRATRRDRDRTRTAPLRRRTRTSLGRKSRKRDVTRRRVRRHDATARQRATLSLARLLAAASQALLGRHRSLSRASPRRAPSRGARLKPVAPESGQSTRRAASTFAARHYRNYLSRCLAWQEEDVAVIFKSIPREWLLKMDELFLCFIDVSRARHFARSKVRAAVER